VAEPGSGPVLAKPGTRPVVVAKSGGKPCCKAGTQPASAVEIRFRFELADKETTSFAYVVQKGNLGLLAGLFGVTEEDILSLNDGLSADSIIPPDRC